MTPQIQKLPTGLPKGTAFLLAVSKTAKRKAVPFGSFIPSVILWCVALLSFVGLVVGEFIYDDLLVIIGNAELQRIHHWKDCFQFVFKPTRPVADLFLAAGQYWGRGTPGAQKLLSVLVHGACVVLLYLNLDRLLKIIKPGLPKLLAFTISLLFAIHPMHSEALGIAQYRMELLGSLFSLSAVWFALLRIATHQTGYVAFRKLLYSLGLFLSLGFATLSKETYFVTAFLLVLLVVTSQGLSLPFIKKLCLMQLFWGLVLLIQLEKDAGTAQPYGDLIGYGVMTPAEHMILAARSLLENLLQILSGRGMTITRLSDRKGMLSELSVLPAGVILCTSFALWIFACFKGGWWRLWSSWILITAGLYLVIPNINIGSEHYWYLGIAGIYSLLMVGLWSVLNHLTTRPAGLFLGFIATIGVSYYLSLQTRITQMRTRQAFYSAELKAHPESMSTWIDMAAEILQTPGAEAAWKAKPFLDEARKMDPNNLTLLNDDFLFAVQTQNKALEAQLLGRLRALYLSKPKHLAGYYLYLGKNLIEQQDCLSAKSAIATFAELKPDSRERESLAEDYAKACAVTASQTKTTRQ